MESSPCVKFIFDSEILIRLRDFWHAHSQGAVVYEQKKSALFIWLNKTSRNKIAYLRKFQFKKLINLVLRLLSQTAVIHRGLQPSSEDLQVHGLPPIDVQVHLLSLAPTHETKVTKRVLRRRF